MVCTKDSTRALNAALPAPSDWSDLSDRSDLSDWSDRSDLSDPSDLSDLSDLSDWSDSSDMSDPSDRSDSSDWSDLSDLSDRSDSPVEARGEHDGRFCFEACLKRGYAVATMCYWELHPDHPHGFQDSILRMYFDENVWKSPERPSAAISAWAWGISRCIDALETQPEIDSHKIAVHGLSRLGKTALWAGANDMRIALTISDCSGTCGAKLSHRYYGEDFSWIKLWNEHWVMPAFDAFIGKKDATIPIDQHQLIGCIAPRLAYVTSATNDCWADPKGEFLSAKAASEFYKLFGMKGLEIDEFPAPGTANFGEIGYYLRRGEHNCTPENWNALLDYADKRLK